MIKKHKDINQMIENDRLHKKNHLWRTVSLVSILLVILLFSSVDKSLIFLNKKDKTKEKIKANGAIIAKVHINGALFEESRKINIINQLADNKNVKAVIIVVSSPGGAVGPSFNLYDSIKHLSDKKPVVGLVPEIAASGGYIAVLPSTRIIASESAILGSIGVIAYNFNLQELAQKIGIKQEVFRSGSLKGFPSNFETTPEYAKIKVQESMDVIHNLMMEKVSLHRKLPIESVKTLSTGTTFWGIEAVKNKLIDQIGTEEDALQWLKNEKNIETTKIQEISMHEETQNKSKIFGIFGILKTLLTSYNNNNINYNNNPVNSFNQYIINSPSINGYTLLLMNSQINNNILEVLPKYYRDSNYLLSN